MEALPEVSLGGAEADEDLIRVMLIHPVMLPQSTWTGNRNYRAQPVAGATLLESKQRTGQIAISVCVTSSSCLCRLQRCARLSACRKATRTHH